MAREGTWRESTQAFTNLILTALVAELLAPEEVGAHYLILTLIAIGAALTGVGL